MRPRLGMVDYNDKEAVQIAFSFIGLVLLDFLFTSALQWESITAVSCIVMTHVFTGDCSGIMPRRRLASSHCSSLIFTFAMGNGKLFHLGV